MKYFLLALSVVVVLAACTQKAPTVTPNRENLLRAKKWRISGGSMTVKNPNGKDTTLDYLNFIDSCYQDDYVKFDSMHFGSLYTGEIKCNPADPISRSFTWKLWNNDNYIDLNDGFNTIFAASMYIEPYRFDTLEHSPLKLDTIIGRTDTTPGFQKQFIVLDTIRVVRFNSTKIPNFDIYGAEIRDFTSSSFKLKFSFKTTRLDSTGLRAGAPNNSAPIVVSDTADYLLNMSGF
jgi:hypothetical protein